MNKQSCIAALAFFAFVFSPNARALDSMSAEIGGGHGITAARVGAQWAWKTKWFTGGSWHLGGYWDLQLGRWDAASNVTDLSITPTFRFAPASGRGPYVEAAVGLHYLSSRNITATKQPGSHWTFGDHIGAGYRFGERGQYDLSLRLQHHSNAGIKQPNPAINFALVRFQYHF